MALKNTQNSNYLKLSFNDSKIMGNKVYAHFHIYKSAGEREKDKTNEVNYIAFMQKLREFIFVREQQINDIFKSYNLNPENPNDNFSTIPTDIMAQIDVKSNYINKFGAVENFLTNYYYTNDVPTPIEYASILNDLSGLGFNEQWIKNPILINGSMEICCGDYVGQPITVQMFYDMAKTQMTNLIDC